MKIIQQITSLFQKTLENPKFVAPVNFEREKLKQAVRAFEMKKRGAAR